MREGDGAKDRGRGRGGTGGEEGRGGGEAVDRPRSGPSAPA